MNEDPEKPWILRALDITGDGRFLIDDVSAWAAHLLFLPGDTAITLLTTYLPAVAEFLGIGAEDHGSSIAKAVSVVIWVVALTLIGLLNNAIRNFDRALTDFISGRYAEAKRLFRIGQRKLRAPEKSRGNGPNS